MVFIRTLFTLFVFLPLLAWADNKNYVILLDGGSTSTKAYLFSYSLDDESHYPQLSLHTKISEKIPVTDTRFAQDPKAYFDRLLNTLTQQFPLNEEERLHTPIYFYATAGVRSLSPEAQLALIERVQSGLSQAANQLQYLITPPISDSVRIISGQEEGLFGWLSTQYWQGNLKEPTLSPHNTEMIFEMGGSSTQIAFLGSTIPEQFAASYKHQGIEYHPYIYSYAGLGTNEAMAMMLRNFQSSSNDFPACFPHGVSYPLANPILAGEGDFYRCKNEIQKAIYVQAAPNQSRMGVYQPALETNHAILTSGYVYGFNVLGIAHRRIALKNLGIAGAQFCSKNWDTLKAENPGESAEYLVTYCFNAALFDTVLRGYGLTDESEVTATDKIDSIKDSTDWASGAVWNILQMQQ